MPTTSWSGIPDQYRSVPTVYAYWPRSGAHAKVSPNRPSTNVLRPFSRSALMTLPCEPSRKPIRAPSSDHVGSETEPSVDSDLDVPFTTSQTTSWPPAISARLLPSGRQVSAVIGPVGVHSVRRPLPSGFSVTSLPSEATAASIPLLAA